MRLAKMMLHCGKSWIRLNFFAFVCLSRRAAGLHSSGWKGFVFSISVKVGLKQPGLEVTHRFCIPTPVINIPHTPHRHTNTEILCCTAEIIGSWPEKWRLFHHQQLIMGWLWSAGCLLWSKVILLVCWLTPCSSLCRVVRPPLPGWKSLTSDLWAGKSSEIQRGWLTER